MSFLQGLGRILRLFPWLCFCKIYKNIRCFNHKCLRFLCLSTLVSPLYSPCTKYHWNDQRHLENLAKELLSFQLPSLSAPLHTNSLPISSKWKLRTWLLLSSFSVGKVKVLVHQSCLTLCDLMDCNLQGSSVHGILQVRDGLPSLLQGLFPTQRSTQVSCPTDRFFTI